MASFQVGIWPTALRVGDMDGPFRLGNVYRPLIKLGIWIVLFLVVYMEWAFENWGYAPAQNSCLTTSLGPPSTWGYGLIPLHLTGTFPPRNMERPLSSQAWGVPHCVIGIGPSLVGDMG